ncbi:hypothetical protein LTS18_002637, partial [Coniosporium uncinatum]
GVFLLHHRIAHTRHQGKQAKHITQALPDKKVYACGFWPCRELFRSWDLRCDHVFMHFQNGKKKDQWKYSTVIRNLLRHPKICEDWTRTLGELYGPKPNWPTLTWHPESAKEIQDCLEYQDYHESAILVRAALEAGLPSSNSKPWMLLNRDMNSYNRAALTVPAVKRDSGSKQVGHHSCAASEAKTFAQGTPDSTRSLGAHFADKPAFQMPQLEPFESITTGTIPLQVHEPRFNRSQIAQRRNASERVRSAEEQDLSARNQALAYLSSSFNHVDPDLGPIAEVYNGFNVRPPGAVNEAVTPPRRSKPPKQVLEKTRDFLTRGRGNNSNQSLKSHGSTNQPDSANCNRMSWLPTETSASQYVAASNNFITSDPAVVSDDQALYDSIAAFLDPCHSSGSMY